MGQRPCLLSGFGGGHEVVQQYQYAQYNSVPAKDFEVMFLDEFQQKFDYHYWNHKGNNKPYGQNNEFVCGKVQSEFYQL